ncbi:hypothetical protein BCR34DRAFT_612328 [Clohesyomyces aquaticus]|uniref:RNase P subunit Pop3-domain-containing protein n=1 Tax=Clohesyomyces aquaticus TaxID=1231657 RepID=A0A1Y1ZY52_9PLEO|nr:hypothetical protein BCR34DRAFT_612328 [Clohesyomyces aquaticus]
MPPAAKKSSKPVFKTDIPFTETTWPHISPEDQNVIIDLLCTIFTPIGDHRRTHRPPSKGKKSNKRKRAASNEEPIPPPPPVSNHILIGMNTVTRHLSALAATSCPSTLLASISSPPAAKHQDGLHDLNPPHEPPPPNHSHEPPPTPLSLLILPHPSPSSSLPHAHLPTLVHLASLTHPSPKKSEPTRLVPLSSASEARLAAALHLPRVGAIGILESAVGEGVGVDALVGYVREKVGRVECKWIEEAVGAEWKGVRIEVQMPGKR